jgi:acylphosphatase
MRPFVPPQPAPDGHDSVGFVVRYRVLVSGRVQGVFFRDTCRQVAEEHDVSGWVRNLPDGRVEAVFEGAPENVRRLVDWAHHGPRRASVADVWVRPEQPEGLDTFQVR